MPSPNFFGRLFGKKQDLPPEQQLPSPSADLKKDPGVFQAGDLLDGHLEIHRTLGKGGFGVVYLVYDRNTKEVRALKTFRDELLTDLTAREAFKKEALLWVNLERHPFIVSADWIAEISGRLFVSMDYISPDPNGCVSLSDHLSRTKSPLDFEQILKWSIQFCLGMEHAQSHGIESHRDIKPDNILITSDGTLKVSDFGLALAATRASLAISGAQKPIFGEDKDGSFGLSLIQVGNKVRCGTPGYMAPEVYALEGADTRSDIYSFGLVLWQMATGNIRPPFMASWPGSLESLLQGIYEKQMRGLTTKLASPVGSIIDTCLQPIPSDRFQSFQELRVTLQSLWERTIGTTFQIPEMGERTVNFWINKGASLSALGRNKEALECSDRALSIDPEDAGAWINRGGAFHQLKQYEAAIGCYAKAQALDPKNCYLWGNTGASFLLLDKYEEAIACFDHAIALEPMYSGFWTNKGNAFEKLGKAQEAIHSVERALELDPRSAIAWYGLGAAYSRLDDYEKAINALEQAVVIDPSYAGAWNLKGSLHYAGKEFEKAVASFQNGIVINPKNWIPWSLLGNALHDLNRYEEAIDCYEKALGLNPDSADEIKENISTSAFSFGKSIKNQDPKKARSIFERAAIAGQIDAQFCLGVMLDEGHGGEQNQRVAREWLLKAATAGHPTAKTNIGWMLAHGEGGPVDFEEAIKWMRSAAEDGLDIAQNNLATWYRDGFGVPQDFATAVIWYEKSAIQGHPGSMAELGTILANGSGVPKDISQAFYWILKAAEAGYQLAWFNCFQMYFHGIGTVADPDKAAYWFERAYDAHVPQALEWVKRNRG